MMILLQLLLLYAARGIAVFVNISNTVPRRNIANELMDAHDGNIVQWTRGGLWYWYGVGYGNCTEKEGIIPPYDCPGIYQPFGACGFRVDHAVNVHTSPDLVHWTFVGDSFPMSVRPHGIYFRPKVIFNNKTQEYILWINYLAEAATPLAAYPNATYVVARSLTPEGPFSVVTERASIQHKGAGDFAAFVDPLTNEAYLAYTSFSTDHRIVIESMLPTFYDTRGANASTGFLSAKSMEAPILFFRQGTYYLLFGPTCCFCARGSGSLVCVATPAGALDCDRCGCQPPPARQSGSPPHCCAGELRVFRGVRMLVSALTVQGGQRSGVGVHGGSLDVRARPAQEPRPAVLGPTAIQRHNHATSHCPNCV